MRLLGMVGLATLLLATAARAEGMSGDWNLPRPDQRPLADRPRVIDLADTPYLQDGVAAAYALDDRRILAWGQGRGPGSYGEWSISLIDPGNAAIDTLWHGGAESNGKPVLSADRQTAWFVAYTSAVTSSGVKQGLYVLDIARRDIRPAEQVYGDAAKLIDAALSDGYWKMRASPGGGVLIAVPDLHDEIWAKPRTAWQLGSSGAAARAAFPYVELAAPGGSVPAAARFGVAGHEVLRFGDARDPRPAPRLDGDRRYYAPTDSGEYYDVDSLPSVPIAAAPELRAQLFNLWRDPKTMLPCGPGNVIAEDGGVKGSTNASGPDCARFIGAYVERADGELVQVLSHGVGATHGVAQRGRLLALGGQVEGLNLKGRLDPGQSNTVSVWDAVAGRRLGDLCFDGELAPSALLISADARELYVFTRNLPRARLEIWPLPPDWTALGRE